MHVNNFVYSLIYNRAKEKTVLDEKSWAWPVNIFLTSIVTSLFTVNTFSHVFNPLGATLFIVISTVILFQSLLKACRLFLISDRFNLRMKISSEGGMLNVLWPDKIEPDNNNSGLKVKVKFPKPPQSVKETLLKVHKANLKTMLTADKGAIKLETDVFALLLSKVKEEQKKAAEFERRRLAILAADPIIWIQEGSCVAIIAQYGNFPVEKKVVEQVLRENFMT